MTTNREALLHSMSEARRLMGYIAIVEGAQEMEWFFDACIRGPYNEAEVELHKLDISDQARRDAAVKSKALKDILEYLPKLKASLEQTLNNPPTLDE